MIVLCTMETGNMKCVIYELSKQHSDIILQNFFIWTTPSYRKDWEINVVIFLYTQNFH